MTHKHTGPVIVGFDDSPAARHALRESAELLEGRRVLVVVVWEAGRAFELAGLPTATLGLPPTTLDIRGAMELDRALYENAERLSERGAALAKELGLDAEGMVVADEITVADTLLRVARDKDSPAIVIGNAHHNAIAEALMGSTARTLIRHSTCPVVVVSEAESRRPAS
jgi:nucleotide-binding universal stress UspA family protein